MAKTRELCTAERERIVSLSQKKLGYRKIKEKTGFAISTIRYVVKKFKTTGLVATLPRSGRTKSTTPKIDKLIKQEVIRDRRISAPKINSELRTNYGVNISESTVRNRLHAMGFKGRVARKKPWVSKKNQLKRFEWAKKHSTWTSNEWKKVCWSDESKFCLFGTDGMVRVWRKPGEAHKNECLRPTVKHGGGSIMVWGSMSWPRH